MMKVGLYRFWQKNAFLFFYCFPSLIQLATINLEYKAKLVAVSTIYSRAEALVVFRTGNKNPSIK